MAVTAHTIRGRLLAAVVAGAPGHRPLVGHRQRHGVERQSVARRRQDHLTSRVDQRPRQPQPVHRLRVVELRDLGDQLRAARGLPRQRHGERPRRRPGHRLADLRRRQGLDVHDHRQVQVAGRRAADRQGRRLHLQLRDQEQPRDVHRLHEVHRQGRGAGRDPRRVHLLASPRRTCSGCGSPSCPSTSGARSLPRRSRPSTRTRRRSSAPGPSRPSSGRRASSCAWRPTRTTGAAPPRSTRSSSRPTRTRTRWRRTSRPAPSRPAGTSRRRSSTR